MTMKKILIVSNSQDLHVERMRQELDTRSISYFILFLDKFPKEYVFSQMVKHQKYSFNLAHCPSGEDIKDDDIRVVWLRKPAPFSYVNEELDSNQISFLNHETEHALFSALYSLNCYWINHPRSLRAAMWKGEQLKRAIQFGFIVPETTISNCPETVRAFYLAQKQVVYKVMSDPVIAGTNEENSTAIATTIIDGEMLEDTDSLSLVSNQFQAYIEKSFELRVTVIGDCVYAAKIDSQLDERTKVDCRNINAEIPYTLFKLPYDIERKCLNFVQSYQLSFAAIDLIVRPDGEYVFLENNPNGQYLFVEERISDMPLTKVLADLMIEKCRE